MSIDQEIIYLEPITLGGDRPFHRGKLHVMINDDWCSVHCSDGGIRQYHRNRVAPYTERRWQDLQAWWREVQTLNRELAHVMRQI